MKRAVEMWGRVSLCSSEDLAVLEFLIRDQQEKDSGLKEPHQRGASAVLKGTSPEEVLFVCVFCVGSLWASELMGASRRSGAAVSTFGFWKQISPSHLPSPQSPRISNGPWGRKSDKATSIHAPFKALIQRGLGGGGDFFPKQNKKGRWLSALETFKQSFKKKQKTISLRKCKKKKNSTFPRQGQGLHLRVACFSLSIFKYLGGEVCAGRRRPREPRAAFIEKPRVCLQRTLQLNQRHCPFNPHRQRPPP